LGAAGRTNRASQRRIKPYIAAGIALVFLGRFLRILQLPFAGFL